MSDLANPFLPRSVCGWHFSGSGASRPIVSVDQGLIERYARRMTIEQRLAEIIRACHADALSSAANLNVDLDIMLSVLAQAILAALRARLSGYAAATPDTLQRRWTLIGD